MLMVLTSMAGRRCCLRQTIGRDVFQRLRIQVAILLVTTTGIALLQAWLIDSRPQDVGNRAEPGGEQIYR